MVEVVNIRIDFLLLSCRRYLLFGVKFSREEAAKVLLCVFTCARNIDWWILDLDGRCFAIIYWSFLVLLLLS